MCSSLDTAATAFIYLGAFLMIYAFVAVWVTIAYDREKKRQGTRLVKEYDEWLGV